MRELEIGEHIVIEDYQSVVVWQGRVSRAGGNLVVVTDEQAPPVDLKPNTPVRVCFSEQRWLAKVRGRVLERENHTVKILLVGQDERVQRRTHMRVPLRQDAQVMIRRRGTDARLDDAIVVDVSESGFQLQSDGPYTVGDSVQVTCCLSGASVLLTGQVVRAWHDGENHFAGIRTTGLSPAAHSAVARFVIECSLAARRTDALGTGRRAAVQ